MNQPLPRISASEINPANLRLVTEELQQRPASPGQDQLLTLTQHPEELEGFLLARAQLPQRNRGRRPDDHRHSGHQECLVQAAIIALAIAIVLPSLGRARHIASEARYKKIQEKALVDRTDDDKKLVKEFEAEEAYIAADKKEWKEHTVRYVANEFKLPVEIVGGVAAAVLLLSFLSSSGTESDKGYKANLQTLIAALNEEQKNKKPEVLPDYLKWSTGDKDLFSQFMAYKIETEGVKGVEQFIERLSTALKEKRGAYEKAHRFSRDPNDRREIPSYDVMTDADFLKSFLTQDEKKILDKLSVTKKNHIPIGSALDDENARRSSYRPNRRWTTAGALALSLGAGTLGYQAMPHVRSEKPVPVPANVEGKNPGELKPTLIADQEPAWFKLAGALLAAGGAGALLATYPGRKKISEKENFTDIVQLFGSGMDIMFGEYQRKKESDRLR